MILLTFEEGASPRMKILASLVSTCVSAILSTPGDRGSEGLATTRSRKPSLEPRSLQGSFHAAASFLFASYLPRLGFAVDLGVLLAVASERPRRDGAGVLDRSGAFNDHRSQLRDDEGAV